METEYNLAINKLKQHKMTIEKEVSSLLIEKDKILNEIDSQRKATTIVYHEQLNLSNIKYFLDEQTKILTQIRDKNYENFNIDYDKHKTILSEIWKSIDQSKKLLSNYNTSKEDLQKLEDEKEKINKQITEKRNELVIINDNIKEKSQELDKKIEENKKILENIEEEKRLRREELEWMRQFEKDLQLMEKRLNNFKTSLKTKWEQQL